MKKLLTLAAMSALLSTASAASLSWGPGNGVYFVMKPGDTTAVQAGDFSGSIPSTASFVLVYLGSSTSFDAASITSDKVVDSIAADYSVDTWGDSAASTPLKTFTVTANGGYSAGDSFGVAWFNGTSYQSIYDVVSYDTGVVGEPLLPVVKVTDLAANQRFSVTASGISSDAAFAVAAPAVPEPSSVALALAGLAMLIKRRKA